MATYLRTLVPALPGENTMGGTHAYGPNEDVRCDRCYAPSYDERGREVNGRCWAPVYGRACEVCGEPC